MKSLLWIWAFLHNNKATYTLGLLIMLFETTLTIGGTWIQQWIIDDLLIAGVNNRAVLYFILLGICLLVAPILFTASAMVFHRFGYGLRIKLGRHIMEHLFQLSVKDIYKERTARFVDYISKDVYAIGEDVSYLGPKIVQRLVSALILMILIGRINMPLLISTSVLCFAYLAVGKYFGDKIKNNFTLVLDKKTTLNINIEEGISATREVVAFHREAWEKANYKRHFQTYYEEVMKSGKLENLQLFWSHPLKWSVSLIVLCYGGYEVINGNMSTGVLVVLWQFSTMLMDDFRLIFEQTMAGFRTVATIDRLRRVTDIEPIPVTTVSLTEQIHSIQLSQVQFAFHNAENQPVIRNLTLDLMVGGKNALVGLSGSGKSTLAKLMVRFYEPTAGEILVNGIPLQLIERQEWAHRLSIVLQEPYFFPDTIRSNLMFGRNEISDEQVMELCRAMLIDEWIETLPNGLDQEIGERGVMLSGGQRQRLALVRALIGSPEVLILDEATSALDLETERCIQSNLDALREGKTTIVIAHRLSTIENADCIFVMGDGKLVEKGTHRNLLDYNGLYRNLVDSELDSQLNYSSSF